MSGYHYQGLSVFGIDEKKSPVTRRDVSYSNNPEILVI
jgi:hypothetical protein